MLNVMRGIRDEKYEKAESIENNHASIAVKKGTDISKQTTLGKATGEKLEAI